MEINSNEFMGLGDVGKNFSFFFFIFVIKERAICADKIR